MKITLKVGLSQDTDEANFWSDDATFEEIYFPASLKELGVGWCCGIEKLNKIIISPMNGQFIFKDDKYLLGKSDENEEEFNNLLFVGRDINEFFIPSNIKIIWFHHHHRIVIIIRFR